MINDQQSKMINIEWMQIIFVWFGFVTTTIIITLCAWVRILFFCCLQMCVPERKKKKKENTVHISTKCCFDYEPKGRTKRKRKTVLFFFGYAFFPFIHSFFPKFSSSFEVIFVDYFGWLRSMMTKNIMEAELEKNILKDLKKIQKIKIHSFLVFDLLYPYELLNIFESIIQSKN